MKQYENKMLLLFGNSEFWPIKISTKNKWLHAKRRALQIYVSCCIGPWAKVCVWLPLRADQRGTFYMSRELFRERRQAEFWIDEKQETNKNELLIAFWCALPIFVINQTKLLLLYGTIPPGKRSSRWWGSPSRRWWCCCFPPSPAGRYFGGTCSSPLRGMSLVVKKFTLTSTSLTSHRTATM